MNKIEIFASYTSTYSAIAELPEGKTTADISEIVDKWCHAGIIFNDGTTMEVQLDYCDTNTKYADEINFEEYEK